MEQRIVAMLRDYPNGHTARCLAMMLDTEEAKKVTSMHTCLKICYPISQKLRACLDGMTADGRIEKIGNRFLLVRAK
jgi:hypothetical protein